MPKHVFKNSCTFSSIFIYIASITTIYGLIPWRIADTLSTLSIHFYRALNWKLSRVYWSLFSENRTGTGTNQARTWQIEALESRLAGRDIRSLIYEVFCFVLVCLCSYLYYADAKQSGLEIRTIFFSFQSPSLSPRYPCPTEQGNE